MTTTEEKVTGATQQVGRAEGNAGRCGWALRPAGSILMARFRSLLVVAIPALAALHPAGCKARVPAADNSVLLPLTFLGTAEDFTVLAGSAVTNTGPTTIVGNLGVSPGTAVTGFPPGAVTGGKMHVAAAVAPRGCVGKARLLAT